MNKFRIIPSILYKDNTAMRGKNFESWRTVGSLTQTIKLYSLREVDEIIFLDVDAYKQKKIKFDLIDDFADDCFMPIVVGGGIRSIENIRDILKVGADRVSINTEAFKNHSFLEDAIKLYGSQCIIVSVDYKRNEKNEIEVWINSGKENTNFDLIKYLEILEKIGVGEVLMTSIDHDGKMEGMDIETLKYVNRRFKFNIIGSGGVGNKKHVLDAVKLCKLKAVSCSSIFHFTENTPSSLRNFLKENGINVRS